MADKIIHEVRLIETDEGYRIEINGDKEKLSRMGFGPMGRWHGGPGHHRRGHHRRHRHRGFGPGFIPPWMWSGWAEEVDEDDEQDVPENKTA